MTEPVYIYIVRSDINDNNIYSEYENANDAIEYARHMKDELTYVERVEVTLDTEGDIVEYGDSETIWVYTDEEDDGSEATFESEEDYWNFRAAQFEEAEANKHDLGDTTWFESMSNLVEDMEENEDMVECKECFDLFPKADCIKLAVGYICPVCAECGVADENTFKVDFPEYEKFRSEEDAFENEPTPEVIPNEEVPMSESEIENDPISTPEEAVPFLVNDEVEAVAGYEKAAEVVADSELENKEEILDTIEHIKEEEEEHIEELTELVEPKEEVPEESENENDPISEDEVEEIEDPEAEPIIEDVEKPTKYWMCFYDGTDICVLEADTEDEAMEDFEDSYSGELFFDSWDHDWGVEEITKEEYDAYDSEYVGSVYDNSFDYLVDQTIDSMREHINDRAEPVESDQELEGTDNAVVDCKIADVVTHSEDEKPVDCEGKKKPLEKPLTEETHAQYAKPEGDRMKSYNQALFYAKKYGKPFIYGYTARGTGKFFALEQPIKVTKDSVEAEKEFRSQYKNCSIVYVAYPDKEYVKIHESLYNFTEDEMKECGMDEDGVSLNSYDEYVRCNWCGEVYTVDECEFEADLGWLCDRCYSAIISRGERLTIVKNPTDEDIARTLTEAIPMSREEVIAKEGTDDVELINAGRPEEERVEIVEETENEPISNDPEEKPSKPVKMANTADTKGMDFETACQKYGISLEN